MTSELNAHSRLRIGIISHSELGGSGAVATDLAVSLASRGHSVHMIAVRRSFRLAERTSVRVHEVAVPGYAMWESPPWSLALASRVVDVARSERLDVIHAHFALPYAVATELACQVLGPDAPPWVATLHGSDVQPLGGDPAYAPIVSHALGRADGVTVPSEQLRALAAEQFGAALTIDVVPNFVDSERFKPSANRLPPSDGVATLVHASNFRRVKRVGDVVAVFARVAERLPTRLLLIGDGPGRSTALEQIAALGLTDRVDAVGAQRDVERWLGDAHVALLPSARESFGLSGLEALASGVPVVGSAVGGLPEVVKHGETGFLFNVGDVPRMADATVDLITNSEKWQAMSRAARAVALERFAPQTAIERYESLYRACIHDRRTVERAASPKAERIS